MSLEVETFTPADTMEPIGPYRHIAKVGPFITIGAIAGVDPTTGELAGPDITSQTRQILDAFDLMLRSVNSGFERVLHVNVYLRDMDDFAEMNAAYADKLGACRPARTAIAVADLPKRDALVTMSLTAISKDWNGSSF